MYIKKDINKTNNFSKYNDLNDTQSICKYEKDISYYETVLNNLYPEGMILAYIPIDNTLSIADINLYLADYKMVVLDGSLYSNPKSQIYNGAGRHLPYMTNDIFFMGDSNVLSGGGSNKLIDHTHPIFSIFTVPTSYVSSALSANHTHPVVTVNTAADDHSHTHTVLTSNEWGGDGAVATSPSDNNRKAESGSEPSGNELNPHGFQHQTHNHWNTTGTFSIKSAYINITHSHGLVAAGNIGTGALAINTDNRPNYLGVYFIQKVEQNYI